jgi:TRAP-type C4-dicarboxylate transport system permease large subunit
VVGLTFFSISGSAWRMLRTRLHDDRMMDLGAGYDKSRTIAALTAAAIVGPHRHVIIMIIYALQDEACQALLFASGSAAGLLIAVGMCVINWRISTRYAATVTAAGGIVQHSSAACAAAARC